MSIARDIQVMHYRNGQHFKTDADRIAFALGVAVSVGHHESCERIEFADGSALFASRGVISSSLEPTHKDLEQRK